LSALVPQPQNWHSWIAPSKLLYAGLAVCSAALALVVCGLRAWNHNHVRRMAVVSLEEQGSAQATHEILLTTRAQQSHGQPRFLAS
jgi:hypothetical protein